MTTNNGLWGQFSDFTSQHKGLSIGMGIAGIASGIGSILIANSVKSSTKTTISQMKENAKVGSKQVADLMSNNALTYLKNGVGLSGSAIAVINQNAEEGMSQIENELSYTRKQLRDNLNSIRNQSFMSFVSTMSNIGMMFGTNK